MKTETDWADDKAKELWEDIGRCLNAGKTESEKQVNNYIELRFAQALRQAASDATAAERERCAGVADFWENECRNRMQTGPAEDYMNDEGGADVAKTIALAIREPTSEGKGGDAK